jgi:signal transduction histidine kinase
LIFTISLTIWWLYFALGLIARFDIPDGNHRQMLLLEGMTLIALLVAGGSTLIYFIFLERKQNQTLAQFFSAFTHDLKTSLASLRLQAESLKEDVISPEHSPTIARLLSDTSRLQVQVENSLFLGHVQSTNQVKPRLFIEALQSQDLLLTLSDSWPQLKFSSDKNFVIRGDRRATETVFNNLAHNSLAHGRATELKFRVETHPRGLQIVVTDNGSGFKGEAKHLGKMHFRQNPSSGSGLGLFIVNELVEQMHGQIKFISAGVTGFAVQLVVPGAVL